jgi:hypothetical protein
MYGVRITHHHTGGALTEQRKRKLWKVKYFCAHDVARPDSKASAYRYVEQKRSLWACRSPESRDHWRYLEILVDVRDGRGWQLHETIDLGDGK